MVVNSDLFQFLKVFYTTLLFNTITASYIVRMFEPIYLYETGTLSGAIGSVEISRFYYNGSHIIMDSSAYASNPCHTLSGAEP